MDERLASRSETGEPGASEHDRRKYVDTTLRSRGMICPGSASSVLPRKAEGAGNAGCTPHPLPCVQTKKTHAGQHRYAEITPALPAQWLYGLLRALPGVPGLLASVAHRTLRFGREAEIAFQWT